MEKLDELLRLLESEDIETLVGAIRDMASLRTPRAMKELTRLSTSAPHPAVRCAALDALGDFSWESECVPQAVFSALHDSDELVRTQAAGMIGERRLVAGGDMLAQLLSDDESFIVRCEAAESLGYLSDGRFVPALIAAVRTDPDSPVRSYAAASLGLLGASPEILRDLLVREFEEGVIAELAAALYRVEGTCLDVICGLVERADDQLATSLLVALDQLAVCAPVRASVQDIDAVLASVDVLASRLPLYGKHAACVMEHWKALSS